MTELRPTRIWDLPTRLFHWALAAAVVAAVVSANIGAMVWHFRFGYCVFGLLLFRILWGFAGGLWSRFGSFLPTPGRVLRYLRGRPNPGEDLDTGHSPLGALSVFALLAVLAVQVGTGLIGDDEISLVGPLNRFVDSATGIAATGWHKSNGKLMVIALVVLHVLAIVVYALRGRRLVPPMVSGDQLRPAGTPASADGLRQRVLAAVLAAACVVFVAWVVSLGG